MCRVGGWLPQDHRILRSWLDETVAAVDAKPPQQMHASVEALQKTVEDDTRLRMLFDSMFAELPVKKPYFSDPVGHHQVRDFKHMCQVINHLLTAAPSWSHKEHGVGLVGLPFNAMFDWPMATSSGWSIFLDPTVNKHLKEILNAWGDYLKSPESAKSLSVSSDGWFGPEGVQDLTAVANSAAETKHRFEDMFICDPSKAHHGYSSWDDFFTRRFRDGVRPVAAPERDDVIANSCESQPYRVATDVAAHAKFWVKGQPYSVLDMLARDELAEQFVGGTIYQAFLSALSYHRWHSPVSGRIVKTYVAQGTYFSEPLFSGMNNPHGPDVLGQGTGQAYISAVATRCFIYIQADNPDIGLMCVMPIGMVEVSTCDITVREGQRVQKGDQLGMVSLPSNLVFATRSVDFGRCSFISAAPPIVSSSAKASRYKASHSPEITTRTCPYAASWPRYTREDGGMEGGQRVRWWKGEKQA